MKRHIYCSQQFKKSYVKTVCYYNQRMKIVSHRYNVHGLNAKDDRYI